MCSFICKRCSAATAALHCIVAEVIFRCRCILRKNLDESIEIAHEEMARMPSSRRTRDGTEAADAWHRFIGIHLLTTDSLGLLPLASDPDKLIDMCLSALASPSVDQLEVCSATSIGESAVRFR